MPLEFNICRAKNTQTMGYYRYAISIYVCIVVLTRGTTYFLIRRERVSCYWRVKQSSEIELHTHHELIFNQNGREMDGDKTVFSKNSVK